MRSFHVNAKKYQLLEFYIDFSHSRVCPHFDVRSEMRTDPSENAVKAQVLVALITYLLLQILKLSLGSQISIPDTMAVIGVMLLMKESISKLLGDLPKIKLHPPPDQIPFAFRTAVVNDSDEIVGFEDPTRRALVFFKL